MEYVSGNIFIREMRFEKKGDTVRGHEHDFDHTTYVAKGSLRIDKIEGEVVVDSVVKSATEGHNWVLIKAGVRHRLTALEDDCMGHCIYAHRNPQGDVVQEYEGWAAAYQ